MTHLQRWDVREGRPTGELGSSRLPSLEVRKSGKAGGERVECRQNQNCDAHFIKYAEVQLWVCFRLLGFSLIKANI